MNIMVEVMGFVFVPAFTVTFLWLEARSNALYRGRLLADVVHLADELVKMANQQVDATTFNHTKLNDYIDHQLKTNRMVAEGMAKLRRSNGSD